MFKSRLEYDLFNYEREYSARADQLDVIYERKVEYLTELYNELKANNDESVISCYYDDNTVEFYTLDEFIEFNAKFLDDEEFDY